MTRTITVRGKANLSVAPDTTILNLDFNAVRVDYNTARELSLSTYNQVLKIAEQNGLQVKDVKTSLYSIESEYKNVKIKDMWEREFVGYKLTHQMKISFAIDALKLGRLIKGIDLCDITPEVSIEYTVKDTTDAKEQLLALAVESSKRKAIAITNAAGVKLGEVQSIDYSWSEMHIVSDRYEARYMCDCAETSSPLDLTPEDIDISDSVTIVWELK